MINYFYIVKCIKLNIYHRCTDFSRGESCSDRFKQDKQFDCDCFEIDWITYLTKKEWFILLKEIKSVEVMR